MPDQTQTQNLADNNDGSLIMAAQMMPDLDGDDPSPDRTTTQFIDPREAAVRRQPVVDSPVVPFRNPNGQFAQQDARTPNPNAPRGHNEDPAVAPDPNAVAASDDQVSDVAEEFFEIPGEKEGDQPLRLKAQEVFEGYQRSKQLEAELVQARQVAPPPVEWDQRMYETVQERGKLVNMLGMLEQTIMPPEPDMNLINPASPNYNDGLFHQQATQYRAAQAKLNQIVNERRSQEQQLERERGALLDAAKMREHGKLVQFWPEIKDTATQRRVVDEAGRYYGITPADFASTHDSRMYAILKDALAFRAGQNQRQTAAKVVRSVPKLVRSPARNSQPKGQAAYSSGFQRLMRSGTEADAADAIGGLLD